MAERKYAYVCYISKRKYNAFRDIMVTEHGEKEADKICEHLCASINFDPEAKTYTVQKGKDAIKWRHKKSEELGVSIAKINKGIKNLNIDK